MAFDMQTIMMFFVYIYIMYTDTFEKYEDDLIC